MSDLVMRIEEKIKEKGTNFKRTEAALGLGNGTIKRWSEQSPRLDKLVLVSEYLQTSLDYLVFGRLHSETAHADETTAAMSCDGVELSPMERDLIAMFRLLPRGARKEVFDLVHFKYSRLADGGAESIFWTYFDESSEEEGGPAEGCEARDGTA